jgi:hypothetical protein
MRDPDPIDATHAALLRERRIAREVGGRRYERAKAAVKEYVANMLRENAA